MITEDASPTASYSKRLVNQMRLVRDKFDKSKQKASIISSFGSSFPLVGREDLCKTIYEGVAQRRLESSDSRSHPILHFSTGPGTGKSAALARIKHILLAGKQMYTGDISKDTASSLNFEAACPVVFSYSDSTIQQVEVEESSASNAFAKRLLYCHFMSDRACRFDDFLRETENLQPTIERALLAIAEDSNTNVLIVGVDEYNKFLEGNVNKNRMLLKQIVQGLAAFQASYVHNKIFLISVFGGTMKQELSQVFAGSFTSISLSLPLLTFEDSYSLLLALMDKPEFSQLKSAITNSNADVVRCLHLLAGHPRSIEQWLVVLCQQPALTLEKSILQCFVHLQQLYQRFPVDPVPLIAASLFEIPLAYTNKLVDGHTVSSLSEQGYCLVEKRDELEGTYFLRLPCFWLWLNTTNVQTLNMLVQKLVRLEFPGTQFEMINFLYRTSLMSLLRITADKYATTSWGDHLLAMAEENILDLLYPGALTDNEVSVSLSQSDLLNFELPSDPYELDFHFGSSNEKFPGPSPTCYLNGTEGKGVDSISWLLPDVVVLEQHKHCNSEKTNINATYLQDLEKKMRNVVASANHFERTPKYLTAVVTNKLLTDVSSHQQGFPSIVISGSSRSFGPFSPVINSSKIDICYAGENELKNLALIGEERAAKVVQIRPKTAAELVEKIIAPSCQGEHLQQRVSEVQEQLLESAFFSAEFSNTLLIW